jgi:UDP-2-acetamido-2-deoxy-ribo-hexuluronate aminotransferase
LAKGPPLVIPFIDLHPVSALVREPVMRRWETALDNCEFVGGTPVQALEAALCAQLRVPHVVACASGSSALILALQASGVGPGSKVALPNLTFWATFEAVAQLGATPVLIDIDPDDLQMSYPEFCAAFEATRFTHALLVHLFGWASARTREFRRFCRERDLPLVEDGAQCFGVTLDGEPLLRGAQLATLSFYPAKVIGGCMDGGAVVAQRADDATRLRSLANHGRSSHYSYDHVGWNSRMSSAAAHYLDELLPHADAIVADRRAAAARYRQAAAQWRGVRCYRAPADVVDNGYLSVLACRSQHGDEAARRFTERGIATGRTYPETMDQQRPAAGRFLAGSDLSRSREFVRRVVNLPLYFGLPAEHQASVLAAAADILA